MVASYMEVVRWQFHCLFCPDEGLDAGDRGGFTVQNHHTSEEG